MTTVNVYLNYLGNCEEAFLFYQSVFGGAFSTFSRFSSIPEDAEMPPVPEELKDKIMHISLPISTETMLMGSDTGGEWGPPFKQGNNFAVSITADSKEKANLLFDQLSAGGTVAMPLEDTFWGDYFGMFEDKFGINWMVGCSTQQE